MSDEGRNDNDHTTKERDPCDTVNPAGNKGTALSVNCQSFNSQDLIVNSLLLLLKNSLQISDENLVQDQDKNFLLITLSILINHLLENI